MLITDRRVSRRPLADAVARAVRGGVTAVMVREPGLEAGPLLDLVLELRGPVAEAGALLLVNHHVDVALAADADGVHLKAASVPVSAARRLVGPDRVVGVSTHTEEEVSAAFRDGADYVVFGPVFPTPSKAGILGPRGPDRYADVVRVAQGPVLALGGVSRETLPLLSGGPVPGVAMIRGILDEKDPEGAARELSTLLALGGGGR